MVADSFRANTLLVGIQQLFMYRFKECLFNSKNTLLFRVFAWSFKQEEESFRQPIRWQSHEISPFQHTLFSQTHKKSGCWVVTFSSEYLMWVKCVTLRHFLSSVALWRHFGYTKIALMKKTGSSLSCYCGGRASYLYEDKFLWDRTLILIRMHPGAKAGCISTPGVHPEISLILWGFVHKIFTFTCSSCRKLS